MNTPEKRTHGHTPAHFRRRLAKVLKESGMSNTALAQKLGGKWTPTKVESQLSGNLKKGPTLETICDLALALDVSAEWLLFGRGPRSRAQVTEGVSLDAAFCQMLRDGIAKRLDGATSRMVYAEDIAIDFKGLTDALIANFSESIRAFAETVVERGKSYARDAKYVPDRLAFEVTSIQHSQGKAAAEEWLATMERRLLLEYQRLREKYGVGLPEGNDALASLNRAAVLRLEKQPPPDPRFVGMVPLGYGRIMPTTTKDP